MLRLSHEPASAHYKLFLNAESQTPPKPLHCAADFQIMYNGSTLGLKASASPRMINCWSLALMTT